MYARVVRLNNDPKRMDEALKGWNEHILPAVKKQPGFLGVTMAGNKTTGDGLAVSYWKTIDASIAARDQIMPEVRKAMEATGGKLIDDDVCEVTLIERIKPAQNGVFVRVTTQQTDVAHLDHTIQTFKHDVLPHVVKMAGSRGVFQFLDKKTGKMFAGSWWDTLADLNASEAATKVLRDEAIKQIGASGTTTEVYEILHTEILTETPVTI